MERHMQPVILFRNTSDTEEEFKIAKDIWQDKVYESRTSIPEGSLVIGRFSVLPFYHELEKDLVVRSSKLINTYNQHLYVADMKNWYIDLEKHTPQTWFTLADYSRSDWEGPVVLKGATNSRRELWKTHMYASNKDEARQVYLKLSDDSLIRTQDIYIRKYEELVKLSEHVSGMPIGKEYRFFIYKKTVVGAGYYWSNFIDEVGNIPSVDAVYDTGLIKWAVNKIGHKNNFYSIDVAQKKDGNWTIIELNDGCMSGVNSIDPKDLYSRILSFEKQLSMGG